MLGVVGGDSVRQLEMDPSLGYYCQISRLSSVSRVSTEAARLVFIIRFSVDLNISCKLVCDVTRCTRS